MTEKIDETLQEFRKRYWSEIDGCMRVWKEIRDNKENSPRDRNEAGKCIARALSALAPDKVTEKVPTKREIEKEKAELDPKHKHDLEEILQRGI